MSDSKGKLVSIPIGIPNEPERTTTNERTNDHERTNRTRGTSVRRTPAGLDVGCLSRVGIAIAAAGLGFRTPGVGLFFLSPSPLRTLTFPSPVLRTKGRLPYLGRCCAAPCCPLRPQRPWRRPLRRVGTELAPSLEPPAVSPRQAICGGCPRRLPCRQRVTFPAQAPKAGVG